MTKASDFKVGDRVEHPTNGVGEVVEITAEGAVKVDFPKDRGRF